MTETYTRFDAASYLENIEDTLLARGLLRTDDGAGIKVGAAKLAEVSAARPQR